MAQDRRPPLPLEGTPRQTEGRGGRAAFVLERGTLAGPYSNRGVACNKAREGKRLRGPYLFWKTEPEVGRDCFGKEAPESHGPRQTAAFAYARKAIGRPRTEVEGPRLFWKEDPRGAVFQ